MHAARRVTVTLVLDRGGERGQEDDVLDSGGRGPRQESGDAVGCGKHERAVHALEGVVGQFSGGEVATDDLDGVREVGASGFLLVTLTRCPMSSSCRTSWRLAGPVAPVMRYAVISPGDDNIWSKRQCVVKMRRAGRARVLSGGRRRSGGM